MKFGFHTYHKYFSARNRIYALILMLFVSGIVYLTAGYLSADQLSVISFAKEINPVPENYSAPLSQSESYTNSRKQVFGFLPSWSIAGNAKVYPEYMDEIIYFGLGMQENGGIMKYDDHNQPLVEWTYLNSDYFKNLQSKAKETNTRISVSIKQFDNDKVYKLITNPTYTTNAANQLAKLVEDYDLDGINIDYEYFSSTDEPTLQHYNRFLTEVSAKLREVNPNISITIDVNATVVYNDNAYDMVKIGELVDHVIVMGYDYHQPNSTRAGPIAPIDMNGNSPSIRRTISSLKGRVDNSKVILGIPFYGYEWQTVTDAEFSPTVANTGAIATYKRVRQLIENREDVSLDFSETTLSPRLVYNQNGLIKQIYYEDERSLLEKIKFIELNGLDGIAIWALGYEGDYIEPWGIIKEHMRTKK